MKKRAAGILALVLAIAMVVTGCGSSTAATTTESSTSSAEAESSESSKTDEVVTAETAEAEAVADSSERYPLINAALSAAPTDLTPWNYRQNGKNYWFELVYDQLFWNDQTADTIEDYFKPVIGKSWTVIDDTTWEVEIFDNVYDTDGNHLTASDVVFCYNTMVDSGYAMQFNNYDSVEVGSDDYHVIFHWKQPVTSTSLIGSVWSVYLYTEKAYNDHEFANEVCGTGPYKLTNYVSGASVEIEARDDYWQTDMDYTQISKYRNVQTLHFDVISDSNQGLVAMQTGAIDFTDNLPAEAYDMFVDGGELSADHKVVELTSTETYMILCNEAKAPTNDLNFRLAVYYAIDKEQVALAAGRTTPLYNFLSPTLGNQLDSWTDTEDYNNAYDPELAKEYLAKSGYDGSTISLMGFNTEIAKNSMQVIQLELQAIGINCEINPLDTSMANSLVTDETAYDLLFYFLGGSNTVDNLNRALNNTEMGNGMALTFIDDAEMQSLYEAVIPNEGRTEENLKAVYNHIIENGYLKTLFTSIKTFYCSDKIAEPVVWVTTFYLNASKYDLSK